MYRTLDPTMMNKHAESNNIAARETHPYNSQYARTADDRSTSCVFQSNDHTTSVDLHQPPYDSQEKATYSSMPREYSLGNMLMNLSDTLILQLSPTCNGVR